MLTQPTARVEQQIVKLPLDERRVEVFAQPAVAVHFGNHPGTR
jgi:hypothetical protein